MNGDWRLIMQLLISKCSILLYTLPTLYYLFMIACCIIIVASDSYHNALYDACNDYLLII